MIQMQNVRAYYYTPAGVVKAVDGITLQVKENEILGIAGESGCGKSTLIKVMYGAIQKPLKIVSGSLTVDYTGDDGIQRSINGADLHNIWWKNITYVPQGSMSVLNPVMTIEKQFLDAIPRSYKQHHAPVTRADITGYLHELDLPITVLKSYPHQLSGGMRQRVIVALATFLKPSIVLADEPTTALDVVVQKNILSLLIRLQERMNNTVVIVSHDIGVHFQVTHRMAIMYAGKIVELGQTDVVFTQPLHPYTGLLIKSLPRIGDRTYREGITGAPPSLLNPPMGCRFSPRCPMVMSVCSQQEPELAEIEPGHYAACHLFNFHPAIRTN